MEDSLKKLVSMRFIVVILVALMLLTAFNTYLIFENTRSSLVSNAVKYDYVLSQDGRQLQVKKYVNWLHIRTSRKRFFCN